MSFISGCSAVKMYCVEEDREKKNTRIKIKAEERRLLVILREPAKGTE